MKSEPRKSSNNQKQNNCFKYLPNRIPKTVRIIFQTKCRKADRKISKT
jgi:hypothetical protein